MKAPEQPANEAARLDALRSYKILDTEFEGLFDDVTALAASILEVPIALITLIDSDRQWFKSRHGFGVAQAHRDISFCGHVVASEAPLVVTDARDDERFADNPFVTGDPRVRFYAGMPLRTPDGFVLGSLCALDHVPRQPTPLQLDMLSRLARQVIALLEARRERHHLAIERSTTLDSATQLNTLFDAMSEGVIKQRSDGAITKVNGAALRILGVDADQLAGRSPTDPSGRCIHEDGAPFPGEAHPSMTTLRTGEPCENVIMGVHKPNGELTWISINTTPLRRATDVESDPHGVLTTFHDISSIKAAQAAAERRSRQEHLITTGTLVSGIGHEINNPLTYIHANIDFSIDELRSIAGGSPAGRLRELIDVLSEARDGADRIRKIVRGLRASARV